MVLILTLMFLMYLLLIMKSKIYLVTAVLIGSLLIAKADKSVGYGMILLDKDSRDVTFQFHSTDYKTQDPIDIDVPGWPKRVRVSGK